MSYFAGFDRIRIINLPSRADRRAEMDRELRRIGIAKDARVGFVHGVLVEDKAPFRKPGEKGVFLAHLNILSDAARAGESVLILEDDVDFTEAAKAWHRPDDCDIAYGGYRALDPANLETSDIIGAHCMGFSARAAQALVPFLQNLLKLDSPPPIDGAYVWFRRQHQEFRTEFASPVVAIQRPSRSDIAEQRWFDRHPILRPSVEAVRRLKRQLARGGPSFGLPEALIVAALGIAIAILAAYYYAH